MSGKKYSFAFRYALRLSLEFVSRFKLLFLAGLVIGVALFFFLSTLLPLLLKRTSVRIGITGRYTVEDVPYTIQQLLSRGLTKIKENGEIEPDIATGWETSDKGKTWLFKLSPDIKWNDGSSLKASDLHYNFSDVETEFPDESTILFRLSTPYSPFPVVVSKPVFKKGLLGSSSWKVDKLTLSGNFIHSLQVSDPAGTSKLYKFYPTEDQTKLAFRLAEVDVIDSLIDPRPLDTWPTVAVTKSLSLNRQVVIFLNTQDSLLSNKNLRQALAYSIDKSAFGQRALSPISLESWSFNPQVKSYDYDPIHAKEIIDDYLADKEKKEVMIKLASYPSLLPVAEKISDQWKQVGIKTSVQVSSITPNEYQAFLAIYDIPLDPDQYSVWHSTQTETNITKYASPRIDKLLEDGRTELDFETRKKIYLDFQRFLLEDSPAIFIYYPEYFKVERL